MRLLHKLRLCESDAITLDFAYRACQLIESLHQRHTAEKALLALVSALIARRLKGREDEVPTGWKWSYAGRTLYISAP
jgi:hypothetical protein